MSDSALERNSYCRVRIETTQRSKKHELKHFTALVFWFVFLYDLTSENINEKGAQIKSCSLCGFQDQRKGFLIIRAKEVSL